nr:mitochondrial phosphate carrier protein 3, mitochondrial-like [Tanacetum cinerariifolium]
MPVDSAFAADFQSCVRYCPIDPVKYKSISSGFGVLLKEQGVRGFFRGWVFTLLGYIAPGACKFGFYEFFKKYYSDIAGLEYAAKYKTLIYLAGSASTEVIADIAICPMEAVKVHVKRQPGFARGLGDRLPKFVRSESALGYALACVYFVNMLLSRAA